MLMRIQMVAKNQIEQTLKNQSKWSFQQLLSGFISRLCLLYFMITICLLGSVILTGLYFPIMALSLIFPSLRSRCDEVLVRAIHFLLKIQIWLNAQVNLEFLKAPTCGRGRLLISNHRSHLDVFLLIGNIQGIRILAKNSLFSFPFLGLMMKTSRQISVNRGSLDSFLKALDQVRLGVRAGDTVHVFPEMTRCVPGFQGTLNFSKAPFHIAIQEKVPIYPIVFVDTDRAWPKSYLGLLFRKPLQMKVLAPIDSTQFQSADVLCKEVQTLINDQLQKANHA